MSRLSDLRRSAAFAKGLARGLLRPDQPSTLVCFVTTDCNAHCPFCFATFLPHVAAGTPGRTTQPLSLSECERLADRLPGLFQVMLGGGEPFLRDDLAEIVTAFYQRSGARLFSLPTNGSMPARALATLETAARRCPEATFNLEVSLDAAGAHHDRLRGLPGGFEKALDLARRVVLLGRRWPNVTLVVSTTLSEFNLDRVDELAAVLAREIPRGPWYHSVQVDHRLTARVLTDAALRARAAALAARLSSCPTDEASTWQRLVDRFYVKGVNGLILDQVASGRMLVRCTAGRKLLVVLADGRVGPCEPFLFEERYADFPSFNLRDYDFDYAQVAADPRYREWAAFIAEGRCTACAWSCGVISSLVYAPANVPAVLLRRRRLTGRNARR